MANYSTSITIDELKAVLSSLKTQRDSINNTYTNDIKKVLESSDTCLKVAGLDTTAINNSISNTFKNLDSYFNGLIDVLENDIILNYSELTEALRQMFGSDFAAQMASLLELYQRN